MELHAFLPKPGIPTWEGWQAAIDRLAIPLRLGSGAEPLTVGGFAPMIANGANSGVEIHVDSVPDLLEAYPDLDQRFAAAHAVFSFRWGADMHACACAFGAAAGLAAGYGALVYSPEDGSTFDDGPTLAVQFTEAISAAESMPTLVAKIIADRTKLKQSLE